MDPIRLSAITKTIFLLDDYEGWQLSGYVHRVALGLMNFDPYENVKLYGLQSPPYDCLPVGSKYHVTTYTLHT